MILWALAVAGSALVLTQSSLTASPREWLLARGSLLGKLVSCPMCSGFWLGATWAALLMIDETWRSLPWPMFHGIVRLVAAGFAGSIVSAIGVHLWLALAEAQAISHMWRSLRSAPPPTEREGRD